jgi:hypothetical protein
MDIREITEAIRSIRLHITNHAVEEAVADNLDFKDILDSAQTGSLIEEYPDDKPYPSCLIPSWIAPATPIHSVWAYNAATHWAVLITVYRPAPERWIDWKVRMKK